jgi:hypothetical protein
MRKGEKEGWFTVMLSKVFVFPGWNSCCQWDMSRQGSWSLLVVTCQSDSTHPASDMEICSSLYPHAQFLKLRQRTANSVGTFARQARARGCTGLGEAGRVREESGVKDVDRERKK